MLVLMWSGVLPVEVWPSADEKEERGDYLSGSCTNNVLFVRPPN